MVARSCRSTLRRDWRDQSQQRSKRYTSGGRFYRRVFRYMGAQGWASGSRKVAVLTVSAAFSFGLTSTTFANTLPSAPTVQSVSKTFDDALAEYQAGRYVQALASAKLAAQAGDVDAQVLTGTLLMNGEAGIIDDADAVRWFRAASNSGNSDAQLLLGKMALKSRGGLSPSDAIGFFSAASQAGRIEARRAIGEMYLKGIGIAPDAEKGREWLRQSADAGDTSGAKKMGDSLFESDPVQALQWYEKAAEAGDADAAYIAAVMYAENYDIRPNAAKAAILMRQAAEAGIAGAQADYGLLVYQGAGVPRSIEDAAMWFEKSAKGGDLEGQFLFAFTLAKGEGVQQNYEEAYYWLLVSDSKSGVDDYDLDRKQLKERLEANVDAAALARARAKAGK